MESAKENIYESFSKYGKETRFSLVVFYLGFAIFLILTGGGCSTLKGMIAIAEKKMSKNGLADLLKSVARSFPRILLENFIFNNKKLDERSATE